MGVHVLIGGSPESGKSVAVQTIIAGASLDPGAVLVLIDGKHGVELATWEAIAHGGVRSDIAGAIEALSWASEQMEERYGFLAGAGLRKITRTHPFGPLLVVVDELAAFSLHPDKKLRERFLTLLHELLARGRAAAIRVVAATQKPGSDVVPTYIRDLFDIRWALRCSTRDASDTVLGAGWASRGFDASQIPLGAAGVGYLLLAGREPVRAKGCYLSDEDLAGVAAYAARLRGV
ncbi:FtsK/SpoIIIE domain-containing protein [Thermopolyspora sp. NPDC052614]|uniref:FtsK/SpoIIIE domain-containing protein n=1 Tax=Thermopolyspora sp. NPDC052614 TaxID=3155682 RepID=UPI003415380A